MSLRASDPGSKCPTCGISTFTPRLDLESSAFQERLLSDYDPTARGEIEAMVSLVDEEYKDCATEIERLQLRLQLLSSRQQQLKLCGLKLRSLLSPFPIRKLPNEVLMYVFDYISQDNLFQQERGWGSDLWPGDENGLTTMPALVLSSVCTRWRHLSLSYSALWSRMTLIVDLGQANSQYTGLITTLRFYIDRSGTSLLRLRIDTHGYMHNEVTHYALSLLGQHSHRWQHLAFIGDNQLAHETFSLSANVHNFPMLEDITFDSTTPGSLDMFGQAPKLWSLVMEVDFVSTFSRSLAFPSWQLTSLVVAYNQGLIAVVDCCPNLISLLIHLIELFDADIVHQKPRVLRRLESLSIVVIFHAEVDIGLLDVVLSSFICPALTSLKVERQLASIAEATWPLQVLESFLIQSSCLLTSLSIKGLQVSQNDFVTVLKQLSSLESLIIEDHQDESETITPSLIQSLHSWRSNDILRPSSDPPLLPKLQHISLTYAGKKFNDVIFVDMIESRCLPVADAGRQGIDTLRSLVLKSLDRSLENGVAEVYEPLRKLEDEAGFRLVVIFA